ncbi:uncharacterized protein LOC127848996 [Dreissena polymorpha]|uniref:uncharacterized protein LOC127848996 n=1 Tax=Dreissena polymorpha TaxID=45954 RepID=UPI002263FF72|nr:uncharacterized protein LOC127848996 [Dreissena polymorpha]
MATFSQTTIKKGSDIVQDFLCSTCEDEKRQELADFYCESCVKFYCQTCFHLHGQLFKKHSPHGRSDMKKWPIAKKVEDFLFKCDVHKEENLSMFCKDHSLLCCNNCAFLNHRQCKMVVLLSDLVKNTSTDLKQVSITIQTTLAELKKLQESQEAAMKSVQISYDEQLQKIQETRRKILAALDMLEKKTLQEMKDALTKLQASLKSDVDKFSTLRDELKQFGDAIQDIHDKGKQELSLIASIKCQDKIQQFKMENFVQLKSSIIFKPNREIVHYLSKLSGIGMIELCTVTDLKIKINGKSEYDVLLKKESKCSIRGIYVLPSGQVLVVDTDNHCVKLLNQQYQMVSHCSVPGEPTCICQFTPSEVGVTVNSDGFCSLDSKVQFIKVNNNQLVKDRELKFKHYCYGIAYDKGDLFLTSGSALYKYSLDGKLVSKLHDDDTPIELTSKWTVAYCALSPRGDKLYITNSTCNQLLTLTRDGSVLSIFNDPELAWPMCVHVTPKGQVLVCGTKSNTILQIDSTGKHKLSTLATRRDGLQGPNSVFYSSNTDSIIVGQDGGKILVYSVGDVNYPFCLQSVSKPLTYAMALNDLSPEIVHEFVGQEPSGVTFNSLSLDYRNKPHNPMINAGAIAICSLLKQGVNLADRFDYCFPEGTNLMEVLDFYFQLCSLEVTCESGSVIAAALANGGVCPITGDKIFSASSVRDTLSLMLSCGLYDYSGEFAFKVGLPAKSGVSGVILIVVPNKMGFCVWSPALDVWGNSVRGVQFAKDLVAKFNFHHYDNLRFTPKKIDPCVKQIESRATDIVGLLFSAYNNDVSALKRYALGDLNMEQADYDGRTALHIGAAEGHEAVIKFLIHKCKCNPKVTDRWGFTPYDDAVRFGHMRVAHILKEAMDNFNPDEKIDRRLQAIDSVTYSEIAFQNNRGTGNISGAAATDEGVVYNIDNPYPELAKAKDDENSPKKL